MVMKPLTEAKYFDTKEERREFLKNLDREKYRLFSQGKVAPGNAPDGRQYKVVLLPRKAR